MKFFLRARHWQLFLLCIGIPFAFMIYGNIRAVTSGGIDMNIMHVFPFLMLLFIGTFMGWMWTLGTNLYKLLPETEQMKINKFKVCIYIPAIYMCAICIAFIYIMSSIATGSFSPAIVLLIIPVHLISIYCMFYNLYFVSKCLKAVQLQRPVKFEDYAGEFFLIWFFFIGIWVIQPRINRMFAESNIS